MKISLNKGLKPFTFPWTIGSMIEETMKDMDYDEVGNVTVLFDIYKDKKRIDTKRLKISYELSEKPEGD